MPRPPRKPSSSEAAALKRRARRLIARARRSTHEDVERARLAKLGCDHAARAPELALELMRAVLSSRPTEAERAAVYEALRSIGASASSESIPAWLLLSDDAWHAGRPTVAEEAVEAAVQLATERHDRRALGTTHLTRARQLAARSRYREALPQIERGLAAVKERERDIEARLHLLSAAIASHSLSPDAPRHARRGVLIASELDDDALLGPALAQLGIALVERGIHGEAREALTRALTHAQGRADPEAECRAQLYLSMLELDCGRALVAQKRVASALVAAKASGSRIAAGFVLGSSGVVQLVRRHPAAAARDLAQAEVMLDEIGDRHARATFLAFLGAAELFLDRRPEAEARFDEARAMIEDGDEPAYPAALVEVLSSTLASTPTLERVLRVEASPVFRGWADVRVACRVVRAWLGTRIDPQPRSRASLGNPATGLAVGPKTAWFALEGAPPVDLSRKPSLRRLLAALLARRSKGWTTQLVLAQAVWPDDARLPPRLLLGRLHVSLSTLRRLGLRDVIETSTDGYRLRPTLEVHSA